MKNKYLLILTLVCGISCRQEISPAILECGNAIWPDYTDVTVPADIAPLNFDYVSGQSRNNVTVFSSPGGETFSFKGSKIRWKTRDWKKLLADAKGGFISVKSTSPEMEWKIFVSNDGIDYGLQYRLIAPGFQVAGRMGIYERSLSDFRERCLIQTETDFKGCVNCHEYKECNPEYMQMHIRGNSGATFLTAGEDVMMTLDTRTDSTISGCAFPYWHPSGDFVAYSTNITRQHFFVDQTKIIEAYDMDSDLQVLDIKNKKIITNGAVQDPDYLETMPSISPDGRTIYFARALKSENVTSRHYNIYKVSFDPENAVIGNDVEIVFDAAATGRSASMARPSYDGKFLMFSVAGSSFMHIFDPGSELWIMNLETGCCRPLEEINSDCADSFHNWSSNSRWCVFESKRMDGLVTHAYISHIDADGNATKPFILPQKDPVNYYSRQFMSYNTPCFVTGPIKFDRIKARRAIESENRTRLKFSRCD